VTAGGQRPPREQPKIRHFSSTLGIGKRAFQVYFTSRLKLLIFQWPLLLHQTHISSWMYFLSVQERSYSGTKGCFYDIVRELQRQYQRTEVQVRPRDIPRLPVLQLHCDNQSLRKNSHLRRCYNVTKAGKLAEMVAGINGISRKTSLLKAFNSTYALGNHHPKDDQHPIEGITIEEAHFILRDVFARHDRRRVRRNGRRLGM
jgi:hypothetical protein